MATEIERKFLVAGELPEGEDSQIAQAYLSLDPERTVRVRIESGVATLTIKGKAQGISRAEFEYVIPLEEAEHILELAVGSAIEKTRRRIVVGKHTWEVDIFHGANEGLVVAEIELECEHDDFVKPDWLREEVSSDRRYFNSSLVSTPFKDW